MLGATRIAKGNNIIYYRRITNNCLKNYRTERAKTCNARSKVKCTNKKKEIEIIQPARFIEKEKAKF